MKEELKLSDMLHYEILTGRFFIKKNADLVREIFPTEEGYLMFYRQGKRIKLKANKVAIEIVTGDKVPDEKSVLHKNLDENDYRLQNLKVIPRLAYLAVKEAQRNLSGALKLLPHPDDMFCYILNWKESGKDRRKVIKDVVVAKRTYNKLQLKYAKILSKYCVFD